MVLQSTTIIIILSVSHSSVRLKWVLGATHPHTFHFFFPCFSYLYIFAPIVQTDIFSCKPVSFLYHFWCSSTFFTSVIMVCVYVHPSGELVRKHGPKCQRQKDNPASSHWHERFAPPSSMSHDAQSKSRPEQGSQAKLCLKRSKGNVKMMHNKRCEFLICLGI